MRKVLPVGIASVVGLVALAYACVHAEDAPAAAGSGAGAKQRIVVLGDSITAGYGLAKDQAYPAILQRKIDEIGAPYQVANSGVSGDTTAGGLRRVDWALGPGASVLIIALGGNDGLRGLSPEQTYQNLSGIIDHARKKDPHITIIVAGMEMPPNMGQDYTQKFAAVFPRIAKEKHVLLVPFLLQNVGGVASLNQEDQIHPNVGGQKKVAENVWAVLAGVVGVSAKP